MGREEGTEPSLGSRMRPADGRSPTPHCLTQPLLISSYPSTAILWHKHVPAQLLLCECIPGCKVASLVPGDCPISREQADPAAGPWGLCLPGRPFLGAILETRVLILAWPLSGPRERTQAWITPPPWQGTINPRPSEGGHSPQPPGFCLLASPLTPPFPAAPPYASDAMNVPCTKVQKDPMATCPVRECCWGRGIGGKE